MQLHPRDPSMLSTCTHVWSQAGYLKSEEQDQPPGVCDIERSGPSRFQMMALRPMTVDAFSQVIQRTSGAPSIHLS